METTDFTRFAEAHRAYAESLFAKIRSLSASPAPNRGVTRFGYSEVEDRVLDALEEEGRALGLETSRDAAGNLLMRLPGRDRTLPGLFCGSHADSVLDGGNFDGLAGITAALLVVRDLQARGVTPARDIVVTALRCEEQGLIGSRAMMGKLSEADLGRRWTPDSPTLAERLTAQGYDVARLSSGTPVVDPKSIAAFLELHIEQGVRLTQPGGPRVGLVTGIRGMVYHRMIHCWGEPAHAGAIDFPFRHDALAATTRLVAGAWERWSQRVAKGEDLVLRQVFSKPIRRRSSTRFPNTSASVWMRVRFRPRRAKTSFTISTKTPSVSKPSTAFASNSTPRGATNRWRATPNSWRSSKRARPHSAFP